MKRGIFLVLLMLNVYFVFSEAILPFPKNGQLYTEFISQRTSPYLKKKLITRGYIIMDGIEKFLFKQTEPVDIEIRKIKDSVFLKKSNSKPIILDSNYLDIMFLFDNNNKSRDKLNIVKEIKDNKDIYTLTPRGLKNFNKMVITAIEDKVEKIEIFFIDKSRLDYDFSNTVTGVKNLAKDF